jgi:hypothetical protein
MARNQNQPFPDDTQDGDVPLPILQATQRSTTNAEQGKAVQSVSKNLARKFRRQGNPFRGEDSWGAEHSSLLGF